MHCKATSAFNGRQAGAACLLLIGYAGHLSTNMNNLQMHHDSKVVDKGCSTNDCKAFAVSCHH